MPSALGGTIFLLTFVISAAIMGVLIFGRPILWYLDNKKREAIFLLGATIGILTLIGAALLALLLLLFPR